MLIELLAADNPDTTDIEVNVVVANEFAADKTWSPATNPPLVVTIVTAFVFVLLVMKPVPTLVLLVTTVLFGNPVKLVTGSVEVVASITEAFITFPPLSS